MKKLVKEADIAVDTDLLDMGNEGSNFLVGVEALDKLKTLESGMPLKIRWGREEDSTVRQSIFMGVSEGTYGNTYSFYDGTGMTGYATLSEGFIKDGSVAMDFDNNDASEVARLLDKVKGESVVEESEGTSAKTFQQWFDETYPQTHTVNHNFLISMLP